MQLRGGRRATSTIGMAWALVACGGGGGVDVSAGGPHVFDGMVDRYVVACQANENAGGALDHHATEGSITINELLGTDQARVTAQFKV